MGAITVFVHVPARVLHLIKRVQTKDIHVKPGRNRTIVTWLTIEQSETNSDTGRSRRWTITDLRWSTRLRQLTRRIKEQRANENGCATREERRELIEQTARQCEWPCRLLLTSRTGWQRICKSRSWPVRGCPSVLLPLPLFSCARPDARNSFRAELGLAQCPEKPNRILYLVYCDCVYLHGTSRPGASNRDATPIRFCETGSSGCECRGRVSAEVWNVAPRWFYRGGSANLRRRIAHRPFLEVLLKKMAMRFFVWLFRVHGSLYVHSFL